MYCNIAYILLLHTTYVHMVSTSISFHRPATGSQWVQIISEFAIIYFYIFAPPYFHKMFLKLYSTGKRIQDRSLISSFKPKFDD